MPKKSNRRGRKFRRYIKGKIEKDLALGTLATKALVGGETAETVGERTLVSSIVATWSYEGLDPVANDGPIIFGVAHSDYTAAEIEAVLENTGSWAEGDLPAQEIANRKVRIIGTFPKRGASGQLGQAVVFNDGRPMKTKLNWILTTGQGLDLWAYNAGTDNLTTGSTVHAYGHVNLWPQ